MIGPYTEVVDRQVQEALDGELERQRTTIELIASENFASPAVLAAQGSVLTNKYAEGYPGKRYYGGCEQVDKVEVLAIERAKELFGAEHVNVQPHSGSQANEAAYAALIEPGDKVLSHGPGPRGAPDARDEDQLQRQDLRLRPLRRRRGRLHRPRRGARDRRSAERPKHDHRRRQRLPARHRLRGVPRDRRRGGRLLPDGHGPHRRARRRGRAPLARAATARSSRRPPTRP